MGAALRSVVHQVDPAVPVMDVTTVSQIVWGSVADRRFYTAVISAFAALAILLTATGLVVVIARSVAERRRELAIRCALGAESRQLMGLVIRQGLTPVILGAAIGLAGAWAGARILERFLFGVTLHEPAVYAGAGLFTVAGRRVGVFPARPARPASCPPPPLCRPNDRGHPPPSLNPPAPTMPPRGSILTRTRELKWKSWKSVGRTFRIESLVQILQPWGNRCNA